MWIRTQDKTRLADVRCVYATKNIGSKQKGTIIAYTQENSSFSGGQITCGLYDSLDKAMDELDRFEKALAENPSGVYKFN